MKKLSILGITLLSIGLFISVVAAISTSSFSFSTVGSYDRGEEKTVTSFPSVIVEHNQTDADAQLGISIEIKRTILGWGTEARVNKWILGEPRTITGFTDSASDKTYRPVLVFNATNDGKSVSGQYYLTQGIS